MQSWLKKKRYSKNIERFPTKLEECMVQGSRMRAFIHTGQGSRELIPSSKGIKSILENKIIIQDDFD